VSTFIKRFAIVLVLCLPACAQTWFSNITKNSTTTSCTIGWTTAVPTVAHVEYGLAAGSYTKSSANSTQYWRSKAQMISGLQPGTTYHFRIHAATDNNMVNAAVSADRTFTTTGTPPAALPQIFNVRVSNLTATDATISWATDVPTDGQVMFGLFPSLGQQSQYDGNDATTHSIGITPDHVNGQNHYYFRARSSNSAGVALS